MKSIMDIQRIWLHERLIKKMPAILGKNNTISIWICRENIFSIIDHKANIERKQNEFFIFLTKVIARENIYHPHSVVYDHVAYHYNKKFLSETLQANLDIRANDSRRSFTTMQSKYGDEMLLYKEEKLFQWFPWDIIEWYFFCKDMVIRAHIHNVYDIDSHLSHTN